jgi:hypothetical protein
MAKKREESTVSETIHDEVDVLSEIGIVDEGPRAATIEAPLGSFSADDYLSRHVEIQLDTRQRQNLRRLLNGLRTSGEKLANGRPVATNSDVVKWLLEQFD